jgi:hypothetical protein
MHRATSMTRCGGQPKPPQPSPVNRQRQPTWSPNLGYTRSLTWLQITMRNRHFMRFLGGAEGERFELSRDETAPNGFRDRAKSASLQVLSLPFATSFASHAAVLGGCLRDASRLETLRAGRVQEHRSHSHG